MKLFQPRFVHARAERRGAALMLAFLVLFVLLAIVFQIDVNTRTESRVNRNNVSLTQMDSAIQSALLQVMEDLKADGESGGEGGSEPGGAPMASSAGNPFSGALGDAGGAESGGEGEPTDSRQDDWARPQRSEINRVQMRVIIFDEESKYNVLCMLTEDEDEAEKARNRVVRILDLCRDGTRFDLDPGEAELMVDDMLDHMVHRNDSVLTRARLLSDDEEQEDIGLPLSLREFVVLQSFDPSLFRDFEDEDGNLVHSISSFLTVWTALTNEDPEPETEGGGAGGAGQPGGQGEGQGEGQTGSSGGGGGPSGGSSNIQSLGGSGGVSAQGVSQGGQNASGGGPAMAGSTMPEATGLAVNLNTAPRAVLFALMDDREVPIRFWEDVVYYRNQPEENEDDPFQDEPLVDYETGEEIITPMIFDSVDELSEIDDWENLEPVVQAELENLLRVNSSVFSVYVTARVATGEQDQGAWFEPQGTMGAREETRQGGLARTVRAVFWRRSADNGEVEMVPLIPWELLDYIPFELSDHAEDGLGF